MHLEGSPYRPNDRVSQLRHALQRLESHMGGHEGAPGMAGSQGVWGVVVVVVGWRAACSLLQMMGIACMAAVRPAACPLPGKRMLLWPNTARHASPICPCGAAAAGQADVVICGDFNSVDQDSPCWLLRRGRLERNHTDACCPQVPFVRDGWVGCIGVGGSGKGDDGMHAASRLRPAFTFPNLQHFTSPVSLPATHPNHSDCAGTHHQGDHRAPVCAA